MWCMVWLACLPAVSLTRSSPVRGKDTPRKTRKLPVSSGEHDLDAPGTCLVRAAAIVEAGNGVRPCGSAHSPPRTFAAGCVPRPSPPVGNRRGMPWL